MWQKVTKQFAKNCFVLKYKMRNTSWSTCTGVGYIYVGKDCHYLLVHKDSDGDLRLPTGLKCKSNKFHFKNLPLLASIEVPQHPQCAFFDICAHFRVVVSFSL